MRRNGRWWGIVPAVCLFVLWVGGVGALQEQWRGEYRKELKPAPPALRAVVGFYTIHEDEDGAKHCDWVGSGVFVSTNYIITAAHLFVEEEREMPFAPPKLLRLPQKGDKVIYRRVGMGDTQFHTAEIVFVDTTADIALVKVSNPSEFSVHFYPLDFSKPDVGSELALVTLCEEQPVRLPLVVASNSFLFPWNSTDDENRDVEQEMLLLSPCMHPGSSGGGFITKDGRLVAVMVGLLYRIHSIASPLWKVKDPLLAAMR